MHDSLFSKIGLWLLCLGAFFMPLLILPVGYRVSEMPKILLLASLVFCVGVCVMLGRNMINRAPFVRVWIVYLVIQMIQTVRSLNVDDGLEILSLQAMGAVVGIGTALLVRQPVRLLRFVALGACGVALIGILEYLGVGFAQLPSAGRPSATLGFRNVAGMYLVASLFLCAALVFESNHKDRVLGITAVTLTAVFLVYTRSRGAWVGGIGAVCLGGVFVWQSGFGRVVVDGMKKGKSYWPIGLAVVLLMGSLPPQYQDLAPSRLDEKKTTVVTSVSSLVQAGGDRGRLQIWDHTLDMIAEHPLVGVGVGNWSVYYPHYDRGDVVGIGVAPRRPHNDFLWIWAELGLIGLLIYVWLLVIVAKRVWQQLQAQRMEVLPALFAGLGLLALLGHSCFSFPREQPIAVFMGALMLGIAGQDRDSAVLLKMWQTRLLGGFFMTVGLFGLWMGILALQFDLHFAKSLHAQQMGHPDTQWMAAKKAQKYGLFDHRVLLLEGDAQSKRGNAQAAVGVYQNYLKLQPHLPAVFNNLGQALEGVGDFTAAEKAYWDGLKDFSGVGAGFLWSNLAALYKRVGRIDEALAISEQAPALSPEGYHNLGLIYAERKQWADALGAYRKALDLAPQMAIVHFSMAGVKMLQEDFEGAVLGYETFLEHWDGKPDYVRDAQHRLRQMYPVLGDRYVRAQRFEDAGRVYERLFDLGDASAGILNNLVLIHGRLGQFDKAIKFGQLALQNNPKFIQMHFLMGTVYQDQGNRALALQHYRSFVAKSSLNTPLVKQAQDRIERLVKP